MLFEQPSNRFPLAATLLLLLLSMLHRDAQKKLLKDLHLAAESQQEGPLTGQYMKLPTGPAGPVPSLVTLGVQMKTGVSRLWRKR